MKVKDLMELPEFKYYVDYISVFRINPAMYEDREYLNRDAKITSIGDYKPEDINTFGKDSKHLFTSNVGMLQEEVENMTVYDVNTNDIYESGYFEIFVV